MAPRPRRTTVLTVVLAAFALVGSLSPAANGQTVESALFGAYATRRGAETKVQAFKNLETSLVRELDIVRIFFQWNSGYNAGTTSTLEGWAMAEGKTPVISVKTKRSNGSAVMWADIANAAPGSPLYTDIERWADRMKAWNRTVYFCFNHEASNHKSDANGTSKEYKAAWRKVWTIFAERGVTNVEWTWIMGDPTPWEVAPTDDRYAPKWYPGNLYTDVLAVDVYNWACAGGPNYRTFASLTEEFLEFAALHPNKATMVAEYGTDEDPGVPGRKAQWIRDAAEDVKSWPNLLAFMAFHSQYGGGCNWWLDTTTSSLQAARDVGAQPFFNP